MEQKSILRRNTSENNPKHFVNYLASAVNFYKITGWTWQRLTTFYTKTLFPAILKK